jgi:hypothetical protein
MKWIIVPESIDDMRRNAHRSGRGGHRGSSAPSSPAIISNGYVNSVSRVGPGGNEIGSAQKGSPRSGSPHMSSSFPFNGPQFTPDRGRQLLTSLQENLPGDGSPLPRHRRPHGSSSFGLSDNVPGSPPVLSSSYLQEDNSFVTPAPHRVHPRLAPPSTAQRPSQVMPTSSPAPFWKYADLTPQKGSHFESSPIKAYTSANGVPPSSSPPPAHSASPTRTSTKAMDQEVPKVDELDDDPGFDLTKYNYPLPTA